MCINTHVYKCVYNSTAQLMDWSIRQVRLLHVHDNTTSFTSFNWESERWRLNLKVTYIQVTISIVSENHFVIICEFIIGMQISGC